ncbi:MAG TPA: hypothetical protein VFC33_05110 [Acidimicrobiia bacterium]|nr:hypothetical protein [Acidimicrobiia bacterium]
MNFVGHLALAAPRGRSQPEFALGAALPDFAAMAGVRLTAAGGAVGAGIAHHRACDEVFHAHPWFTARCYALRDALLASGVPRGPARACAHAGVELLLDGALMTDEQVRTQVDDVFARASDAPRDVVEIAPAPDRDRWRGALVRITTTLDPGRYADVRFAAERLRRMTARRPRLALPVEDLGTVAAQLAAIRSDVVSTAQDVVDDVAGRLGNDT